MKTIGLFFGSFNPIHNGHIMIANYCMEEYGLDGIFFVVAAHNPFKDHNTLLSFDKRAEMVNLAIQCNCKMTVDTTEMELHEPFYTFYTIQSLKIKYPDYEFVTIIGIDNWMNFDKWFSCKELLQNRIIVVPRGNSDDLNKFIKKKNKLQDMFYDIRVDIFTKSRFASKCPNCSLSSSFIRNEISKNHSILGYTPQIVIDYIKQNKLYGL